MDLHKNFKSINIGILGGGQLGRMFIQNALNYNLIISVLDADALAPCAKIADNYFVGDITDFNTVLEFGKTVELITIEIENVNCDALFELEKLGKKVFPQARVIKLIQDKGLQKQFYLENNFPTSPFKLINAKEDLKSLSEEWFPSFIKMRKAGYDGKGVIQLKDKMLIENAFDVPSILERRIKIDTEFAIITAANGVEVKAFPAVDMLFHGEANLVEFLSSPSAIKPNILEEAEKMAIAITKKLEIRGLLAIEFFLDKEGRIFVNEMAPRPHNSGHHTIEANKTSQFDQFLRAIMGWPLGETDLLKASVMVNVLGEDGFNGNAVYEGIDEILGCEGVYVHLYGKRNTKPFRKMGHVTITDDSLERAIKIGNFVKKTLKVKS
jgi:5-(carboxyamino)imidazole ribonucleotide synthase